MPYYQEATGIIDDSITDAKLANMPEATVKGRALAAGEGDPQNLTGPQIAEIIGPLIGPPSGPAGGDLAGTYPDPTLTLTGVGGGTFGDAGNVPRVTVDPKGRITAIVAIPVGSGPPTGTAGGVLFGSYPNPSALANNAVLTSTIVDGSVTTPKIANANVTINHIADNAINTPKIVDANVTNAKLATMAEATIKGRAAGAGAGVPQDLTAAQVTALLPAAPLSYRNILGRNGGFEVWQRGAGGAANFTVAGGAQQYTADGWYLVAGAGSAMNVGPWTPLTNGSRFNIILRRTAGQTGTAACYFEFPLDTDEIAPARGSVVTLSFTAQGGANWSPSGGTLNYQFVTGTGAAARITSGSFVGSVQVIATSTAITPGGAATRIIATSGIVVPANATQATLQFYWTPTGTAGADDYLALDDVQLEIGSVATPFERRPFEQELLACQRHYFKTFPYNIAPAWALGDDGNYFGAPATGGGPAAMNLGTFRYSRPLRVPPTVTFYNPGAANNQARNMWVAADCSGTSTIAGMNALIINVTGPASGGTAQAIGVHATADAGI